jgi:hypothetical protein
MTTHPDLTTAAAYMDEAMKAIALAKQALLGGAGGALFVSTPALAEAEASPGNPYGSTRVGEGGRGDYDAGSAAEVADAPEEDADAQCGASGEKGVCTKRTGHGGDHVAHGWMPDRGYYECWRWSAGHSCDDSCAAGLCPAQWGEPPETMLCSLTSGHDGNHATAEGIEWGGAWQTAEPSSHGDVA